MIRVYIQTSDGKRVHANNLDWRKMNAAGWDDVYTGQRAWGWDDKGNLIVGIAYPDPPQPLSTRPRDW